MLKCDIKVCIKYAQESINGCVRGVEEKKSLSQYYIYRYQPICASTIK